MQNIPIHWVLLKKKYNFETIENDFFLRKHGNNDLGLFFNISLA